MELLLLIFLYIPTSALELVVSLEGAWRDCSAVFSSVDIFLYVNWRGLMCGSPYTKDLIIILLNWLLFTKVDAWKRSFCTACHAISPLPLRKGRINTLSNLLSFFLRCGSGGWFAPKVRSYPL